MCPPISWGSFAFVTCVAIGVLTIIFAVLERVQQRPACVKNWEPLKLPHVRDAKQISRLSSLIELAANLVFLGRGLVCLLRKRLVLLGNPRMTSAS
jgi:Flp pilus assembly protein protease CpaA